MSHGGGVGGHGKISRTLNEVFFLLEAFPNMCWNSGVFWLKQALVDCLGVRKHCFCEQNDLELMHTQVCVCKLRTSQMSLVVFIPVFDL